jgi:hypothetical protein
MRVRHSPVDDVSLLVREQQAGTRSGEVVTQLIEDRCCRALESAPLFEVGVVGSSNRSG